MIVAIDCDLRTSYAVTSEGYFAKASDPCAAYELIPSIWMKEVDTVLFEIASPVSFNRGAAGHAAMTQLAKWALWNVAQAAILREFLLDHYRTDTVKMLVAPSNVWTHGHELKMRHTVAGCKLKQKDLRECEAMIYYYKQAPTKWKPLAEYLATL
jgi:hypothetical protein